MKCTVGALLVYGWFTPGAPSVQSTLDIGLHRTTRQTLILKCLKSCDSQERPQTAAADEEDESNDEQSDDESDRYGNRVVVEPDPVHERTLVTTIQNKISASKNKQSGIWWEPSWNALCTTLNSSVFVPSMMSNSFGIS